MPRPTNATLRPNCAARFTRICSRYTLVANDVTTILPLVLAKISSNAGTTSTSEPVKPGRSMFVLSENSASTPAVPSSAKRWKSKCSASSGVWSTLKSPVWTMTPSGVWIATATQSGMLCVTRRNSSVTSPTTIRSRGRTGTRRPAASMPCSASLASMSASVIGVP